MIERPVSFIKDCSYKWRLVWQTFDSLQTGRRLPEWMPSRECRPGHLLDVKSGKWETSRPRQQDHSIPLASSLCGAGLWPSVWFFCPCFFGPCLSKKLSIFIVCSVVTYRRNNKGKRGPPHHQLAKYALRFRRCRSRTSEVLHPPSCAARLVAAPGYITCQIRELIPSLFSELLAARP